VARTLFFLYLRPHDPRRARPIADQKRELREAALARRDLMPPDDRVRAARKIGASAASGRMPNGSHRLRLLADQYRIQSWCPCCETLSKGARAWHCRSGGPRKPLSLRAWSFGEPLVAGVWGIREPGVDAPEVAPDIGARSFTASTAAGYRIGYGAGYYDMTLRRPAGEEEDRRDRLGFAAQEVERRCRWKRMINGSISSSRGRPRLRGRSALDALSLSRDVVEDRAARR